MAYALSSDEDEFFDADEELQRNSLNRIDLCPVPNHQGEDNEFRNIISLTDGINITAEEDEALAVLSREKERLAIEKREAEVKLREIEVLYERKQSETRAQQLVRQQKRESQQKLVAERDERVRLVAQEAQLKALEAESLAKENEKLRQKLSAMRDKMSHDSTLGRHSELVRSSSSSLERPKATLGDTDTESLIDDIVSQQGTQEYMQNLDAGRKSTINKHLGVTGFNGSPNLLQAISASVSTSTPIMNLTSTEKTPWSDSDLKDISDIQGTPSTSSEPPSEHSSQSQSRAQQSNHSKSSCQSDTSTENEKPTQPLDQSEEALHNEPKPMLDDKGYICDTPVRRLYVDLGPPLHERPSPHSALDDLSQLTSSLQLQYETAVVSPDLADNDSPLPPAHRDTAVRPKSLACEPDVVSSTRPNSLKREENTTRQSEVLLREAPPSAPPRKRKTKSVGTPSSEVSDEFGCMGLPPLTPSSSVQDVSSPGLLNLKTATLGKRFVNTQDADKEAGALNAKSLISDEELLARTPMKNLDTGETISLSEAKDKVPATSVCPLSLHVLKLAQGEAGVTSPADGELQSDGEGSISSRSTSSSATQRSIKRSGSRLKKLLKGAVHKVKAEVKSSRDDHTLVESDCEEVDDAFVFKGSAAKEHKGPYHFDKIKLVQDMSGEHTGPVWSVKFSVCGRLLATGGQDAVIRVWTLKESYTYFDDMRQKYNETRMSSGESSEALAEAAVQALQEPPTCRISDEEESPFMNRIFMSYRGHTGDILDLSWSKNYFLLSSSMDKTVRLWHISRLECLCCFQHIDFVTAISFHPRDDRYFLSGSLDGKLRLWSIPDKKVALWNEVTGASKLITAANFCQNGRFAVVGTYDGRCIFYSTEQLKYFTSINVRSTRGKNAQGHKVTAIQPLPQEDKILVTTNDSRLRLYDLRDLSLSCKFRGCANLTSQIRAGFSHDGQFILCGSEDHSIYFWKTQQETTKFSASRRDRNDNWESIKAHNAVVTAAVFAPHPNLFFNARDPCGSLQSNDTLIAARGSTSDSSRSAKSGGSWGKSKTASLTKKPLVPVYGYGIVTADYSGSIKVLLKSNDKF